MSLKGKEVLIIDDTDDVRLLCRKIVESTGMIVTEASSVDQAMKIIANKVPHLILLDLNMPGKSGFVFLQEKAHLPPLASVPILVVSAAADKDSVYKAIVLGAADYTVKPFTTAILMQKIRKLLRETDFCSYKFPANEIPEITFSVPAEISKPNETGFFIESPIKLSPNANSISNPII